MVEINNIIKRYLKKQKVTQIDFAKKLGVCPETVWRYINNRSCPTRKQEKKILKIIGY
jgi:transcriptional regulator with XRE-family HTH domain